MRSKACKIKKNFSESEGEHKKEIDKFNKIIKTLEEELLAKAEKIKEF